MNKSKEYLRKNVSFSPDNEEEMNLYKLLDSLKYGEFSKRTKEFWKEELLRKEKQSKKIQLHMENDPIETRKKLHHIFEGGINE